MRKLKLQVQMTLDGFISGTNGEMDWLVLDWSADLKEFVTKITDPVDTILLGKNLAQGFIPYWTETYNSAEPMEGCAKFVETPKVVFSRTMTDSIWERTTMANGHLQDEVHVLKNEVGGDMIVYGGGKFVSSLIKEKLIDELHFFVNPAILGDGMTIFKEITEKQHYTLISAIPYECGIVVLSYQPK
jgi:dihydrofolate reductase